MILYASSNNADTTHHSINSVTQQVSVTSVQKIEGDATVSMIRGKKKYLYDLCTTVRWKVRNTTARLCHVMSCHVMSCLCHVMASVYVIVVPCHVLCRMCLVRTENINNPTVYNI